MNLENLTGTEQSYSLADLVPQEQQGLKLPSNAVKTRAAKTALLTSDPAKMMEDYQLYVAEGEQGRSDAIRQAQNRLFEAHKSQDIKGVMSVLSDPLLSYEEKNSVIQYIKNQKMPEPDTSSILLEQSLAKESGEETPSQEEARLAAANWLKDINDQAAIRQGMVNAHGASLTSDTSEAFVGMLEQWFLPFMNNIDSYKLYKSYRESIGKPMNGWDTIKALLLAGSNKDEMREHFKNLPPHQKTQLQQSLTQAIQEHSGTLMSDNQFSQYEKMDQLFGAGYSDLERYADDLSGILDIFGLGMLVRRASKVAKPAEKTIPPKPTQAPAPEIAPPPAPNKVFEELPPQPTEAPKPPGTADMPPKPKEGIPTLLGGTGKKEVVEEETKKVGALLSRVEMNNAIARENPTSVAKTIQQTNPETARALHASVARSEGDAVAEALYGTSRIDALASDTFPQAALADGAVVTRPTDIERNLRTELNIPQELIDILYSNGRLDISPVELAKVKANVVRNFNNADGLTINDAMSSFAVDGDRIKIGAVYGSPEGGFATAEEAIDRAKISLRQYGIRSDEIILLEKQGLDHVPVNIEDVRGKPGNYMIRVETQLDIDTLDVVDDAGNLTLDKWDVKRNWLDAISPWIPLIQDPARHIMDAASMLPSQLTGAASVATNLISRLDKFLLDKAAEYSDRWNKHSKAEKVAIDEYIREANFNRIAFDPVDLAARQFTPEMIETVKKWREFWDAHFYLENYDLVRTMNAEGFELFHNASTTLFVKPLRKKSYDIAGTLNAQGTAVQGGKQLYNPATGDVTVLTKDEIDTLYQNGGFIARLRRPQVFNGVQTDIMMVRNTPTEYTRKFRDTDQVLNYINGYFQIQYKAPRFVDEIRPDGTRRAIAVAGDWKEAEVFAVRMRGQAQPGYEYVVRSDDRALQRGSDDWWDVNSAHGRIAQRHRGKLLEDSSGMNFIGDSSQYILNPVDSAVRAARSIAGRTITRPVVENLKQRILDQYGHLFPSNGMGGHRWPAHSGQVMGKGRFTDKEVRDARTMVNYVNYLENGYVNGVDHLVKAGLHWLGESFGRKGFKRTERLVAQASQTSGGPIGFMRSSAAHFYLFWNPLRQLVVQSHQIVRASFYNPVGMANGQIGLLTGSYLHQKAGLPFTYTKTQKDFFNFVEESGLITNIDKQNLVRGSLTDAAQSTNKVVRIFGKASTILRKAGFDLGETVNRVGHAAAVYDLFKRQGLDVTDKRVKSEMISKIDAITYDMNFAGDMPYNQTSASLILQFMQVPHKALLQYTNRRITKAEKFRLAIGDLAFFGTPALAIAEMLDKDILADNPELREYLRFGLETIMLNKFFTWLSGEKTNIDFSSLSPYSASGWREFFAEMFSDNIITVLTNSPAGSIYFKDGGKLDNILTKASRYFQGFVDPEMDKGSFVDVVNEVAKLSSGWSNALKMRQALALKAHMEKYGLQSIDPEVNTLEAYAQLFGFTTQDVADYYSTSKKLYEGSKSHREDVLKAYNDIKLFYSSNEDSPVDRVQKISGAALLMFKNDPLAQQIIAEQLARDIRDPNERVLQMILKGVQMPDPKSLKDTILQSPISDEQKQKAIKAIEDTEKARADDEEGN